mgnify:FL=1
MRPKYKQLCAICKKNHVLISSRGQFPICTSCSMKQINQPIEDKKFKAMFDIDQKLYEQSSFLRSIKYNYLRFGSLSDKQIEMFKKVALELANPKRKEPSENHPAAVAVAATVKKGEKQHETETGKTETKKSKAAAKTNPAAKRRKA